MVCIENVETKKAKNKKVKKKAERKGCPSFQKKIERKKKHRNKKRRRKKALMKILRFSQYFFSYYRGISTFIHMFHNLKGILTLNSLTSMNNCIK